MILAHQLKYKMKQKNKTLFFYIIPSPRRNEKIINTAETTYLIVTIVTFFNNLFPIKAPIKAEIVEMIIRL